MAALTLDENFHFGSTSEPVVPLFNPAMMPTPAAVPVLPAIASDTELPGASPTHALHTVGLPPAPAPPLAVHWFYEHEAGGWIPFSAIDTGR